MTTGGYNSTGIFAYSIAGAITITSGTVATDDEYSTGIYARASGEISIGSTSVTTAGGDSAGIVALGLASGDVTVNSVSVSTAGSNSGGIGVRSEDGNVIVDSGTVTTTGSYGSDGIHATAGGEDSNITDHLRHRLDRRRRQHRHLRQCLRPAQRDLGHGDDQRRLFAGHRGDAGSARRRGRRGGGSRRRGRRASSSASAPA